MRRRWRRMVAVVVAGGLVVTGGCGPTHPDHSRATGSTSPGPPASSGAAGGQKGIIQTRYAPTNDLEFDVLALGRVNANVVALRLRVTNTGGTQDISDKYANSDDTAGHNCADACDKFSDLALLDGQDMKSYYPLVKSSNGSCLCSGWPQDQELSFGKGASFTSTILYPAPPPSVHSVDISTDLIDPFTDIPIAGRYRLQKGDPDPGLASGRKLIRDLTERGDALDKSKSVRRNGRQVQVLLDADVLFKFDKSTLTSKAGTVLKYVADRIDKATATTVHVDGYTDDKGEERYNEKLSRRRAASVVAALKRKVTRRGVTFASAGHGESDPVAGNDSAKGRRQNRRVTVTLGS